MCGLKPCKECASKSKVSGMKKYSKYLKKSTSASVEDIGYFILGGAVSLAANLVINKATANLDPSMAANVKKVIPVAKAALGGYLLLNNRNRMYQFAGAGMLGVGTVETLTQVAPQYFAFSGTESDLFTALGSADPSLLVSLNPGSPDYGLSTETILGTNVYDQVAIL